MAGFTLFQTILSIFSGILVATLSGYVSRVREDKRWLKERVYPKLYNEVKNAEAGQFPTNESSQYESIWKNLDHYERYRVDDNLREDLDKYSKSLRSLNDVISTIEYDQNWLNTLPSSMIEMSGNGIVINRMKKETKEGGRKVPIIDWLNMFGEEILDSDDPDEMKENLLKASKRNQWTYESTFQGWDRHEPNWHKDLYNAVHNDENDIRENINRYLKLKDEQIPNQVEKIRDELETRIHESLIKTIGRRWRQRLPQ